MASSFAKSSAAKAEAPARRKVARFVTDEHEHAFKAKDGTPTGQVGYAFRVMPVDADGNVVGMTMWVWLDDHTALAALIDSLPAVYAAARETYGRGVEGEGWPKLPSAKAAQEAPAPEPAPKKTFGASAPKASAPKPSEGQRAKAAAIDDGLEAMPF